MSCAKKTCTTAPPACNINDCEYDFSCMNINDNCDTGCFDNTCYDDCASSCSSGGPGKRQKIKNWFKDKFEGSSSSCSSNSSNCGDCYDDCVEECGPCEPVCEPCPAPKVCKPKYKTKTCYRTVCEQVKVPCKKVVKVPKQITCYRRKVTTECVPTTKKVWKRVDVCGTKTVKKPVKEAYCKTIMVDKVVKGCKTVNVTKKVPYQVCWTETVNCPPLIKTTCENICLPKKCPPKCPPVCEPVCEPICDPCPPSKCKPCN